jgi:hypothetical protein
VIGTRFSFGWQELKVRQKEKRKKCPTSQNKKVKKCKDVDLEVWWKLGAIDTGLVLEVVTQISKRLWLKPKQGFAFLFLTQEGSYRV